MRRIIWTVLFALCVQACVSHPKKLSQKNNVRTEIITIASISELEQYVDNDTLVLFDLDHTVFEGAHIYGHAHWFYGLINEGKQKGISESETIKQIFPAWLRSQERAFVKPVESVTPELIQRLQQRGINVMGLTARQTPLIAATLRQLEHIEVDFSKSSLKPALFEAHKFVAPVAFSNGIIFTSEFVKKSEVLKYYFERINFMPKRIVFVDDTKRHVEDLAHVFSALGVTVIGLHYPLVQARNTPWNQAKANDIFEHCNHDTAVSDQRCRQAIEAY